MTKPTVFNYKNHEELRQAYKELLADNQQLIADNRTLRKEVVELKQLNDGYVKIIAKNKETNNKLMASVQKQTGGDYISRADAMSQCKNAENELTDEAERKGLRVARFILGEMPSADAVPTIIRAKTFMRKEDFDKWANEIKKQGENIVCIPCDAEHEDGRPHGEWIKTHEDGHGYWVGTCNNCGKYSMEVGDFCPTIARTAFAVFI